MIFNVRKILFLAVLWMSVSAFVGIGVAASQPSREEMIKAAYIYNFTIFVEWPNETKDFNICILNTAKLDGAVNAIEKKSTPARKYNILHNPSELSQCQIVYLGKEILDKVNVEEQLRNSPILTIKDVKTSNKDYTEIISFVKEENRIKLVVNLAAAKKRGLKIDSQLLEVASEVIGK